MSETPESVRQLLQSEEAGDRLRGLNLLRQLDPTVSFELVRPALTDRNARVRYAATSYMASIGRVNRQEALELLRDRLHNDKEDDVLAAAADALGALKLTEAYEEIETLYQNNESWLVRASIVASLGEMGDRRAFSLLSAALESPEVLQQTAAIGALGDLGDDRAIPFLLPFASNADWQMRYRVAQALGKLGGAGNDAARAALETLAEDRVAQVADEAKRSLQ